MVYLKQIHAQTHPPASAQNQNHFLQILNLLVLWSVCLCQELVGVIFYVSAPPLSFDLDLFLFFVSCFAYFPWHQLRALSQAPGKALQMQMCYCL